MGTLNTAGQSCGGNEDAPLAAGSWIDQGKDQAGGIWKGGSEGGGSRGKSKEGNRETGRGKNLDELELTWCAVGTEVSPSVEGHA